MKLRADQMLDTRDALVAGGPGTSTTVFCTHQEARHLRDWLLKNGIETKISREGDCSYRITRKEESREKV